MFSLSSLISGSELLEKLCLSLYDVLRPLIIHIVHLETLSELCSILKNEMLEDHVHNNGGLHRQREMATDEREKPAG